MDKVLCTHICSSPTSLAHALLPTSHSLLIDGHGSSQLGCISPSRTSALPTSQSLERPLRSLSGIATAVTASPTSLPVRDFCVQWSIPLRPSFVSLSDCLVSTARRFVVRLPPDSVFAERSTAKARGTPGDRGKAGRARGTMLGSSPVGTGCVPNGSMAPVMQMDAPASVSVLYSMRRSSRCFDTSLSPVKDQREPSIADSSLWTRRRQTVRH